MKKRFALALCALLAMSSVSALAAESPAVTAAPTAALISTAANTSGTTCGYPLSIDGKSTDITVTMMVPLRAVAEQLGFTVTWNGDGTITLDNGVMHSTVTVGRDLYQVTTSIPDMVGMSAPFSLGVPPYVVNGVTYAPLGLFDALLGSQAGAVTLKDGVVYLNTKAATNGQQSGSSTQIANPFVDCTTLAQAQSLAGIQLTLPESIGGSDSRCFRAVSGELLEVIYTKDGQEVARVRKAPGKEDISGDYNTYAQVRTEKTGSQEVTLKGADGLVSLAVWSNGSNSYSISVEAPVSEAELLALTAAVR